MKNPHAPGGRTAGASIISPGSERSKSIAETGIPLNEIRLRSAAVLDREADIRLQQGFHRVAERLAHAAAEIRAGAA